RCASAAGRAGRCWWRRSEKRRSNHETHETHEKRQKTATESEEPTASWLPFLFCLSLPSAFCLLLLFVCFVCFVVVTLLPLGGSMELFRSEAVVVERDADGGAALVLGVPGRAVNVLTRRVLADLEAALAAVEGAGRLPVLIVRSNKKTGFLAGADL